MDAPNKKNTFVFISNEEIIIPNNRYMQKGGERELKSINLKNKIKL